MLMHESACLRSSNQTFRIGIRQAHGAPLSGLRHRCVVFGEQCCVLLTKLLFHADFCPAYSDMLPVCLPQAIFD